MAAEDTGEERVSYIGLLAIKDRLNRGGTYGTSGLNAREAMEFIDKKPD
jgi:hypothetical protein